MRANTGGGLALVPTAAEVARNRDSHFPFRHDSYFYYLSGFPGARGGAWRSSPTPTATGTSCSAARRTRSARSGTGFATAPTPRARSSASTRRIRSASCDTVLADLCADRPALYTPLGLFAAWDRKVTDLLNEVRGRVRTGVAAPEDIVDVRQALDAMRLVKDAHEQALMRRAATISSAAHRRAMAATRARAGSSTRSRPSSSHEFLHAGAQAVAYPSIVAGGPNACVLHYRDNNRELQDGELLLIDAGCEYQGYASDITRTFPVNGRFSGPQKDVYELVLAAQAACIDGGPARRRVPRLPQGGRAGARAGVHRPRPLPRHARRGARDRQLQAVLHAPRRALAGDGRPRRRSLPGAGRVAAGSPRAWC